MINDYKNLVWAFPRITYPAAIEVLFSKNHKFTNELDYEKIHIILLIHFLIQTKSNTIVLVAQKNKFLCCEIAFEIMNT